MGDAAKAPVIDEEDAGPDLLERLRGRTSGSFRRAHLAAAYNHPALWYMRPDGDVVRLPGDPIKRAYYEDKGFAVLRPEEVREWLREVRPQVVAGQRERAGLLNTIHSIERRYKEVELMPDLDEMDVAELQGIIGELGKATGAPIKVIGQRYANRQAQAEFDDEDEDLDGAESGVDIAALQNATQRAANAGKALI